MNDYKPNSHRSKAEQAESVEKRKIDKVITGTAKVQKKSEIKKLTDSFIKDDIPNVMNYVKNDVLIPAIKDIIWNTFTNSLDMILFNGTGHHKKRSGVSKISYSNYYDRKSHSSENRTRSGYSYDDIVLETRAEAEDVIERMTELIDMYDVVSVADLYDLVGISGNYTDNKYGWTNVRNARVVKVRDGFLIEMPKVGPIN